ncbi:MAG: aspartate ammonia-lyase [Candidatus Gastranaerophilales bacterium]|nr:aspartate ammonia-lyase [Candidatus Gastranaerophilales bacterium]
MRKEKDILGELLIPQNSYTGIHTERAKENFSVSGYKIHPEFIKAYGMVKLACATTISGLKKWDETKSNAIIDACSDLIEGKLNEYIVVDALQGGAGTSLNMNVNEVIANRALEYLGNEKGDYEVISPISDINMYQSTNDTFPTALKIACIKLLRQLETQVISLQEVLENKEKEFADIVKIARTQLTEAVLTTLGKEFSAYAEAISRDRWRIYKCEERLRVVNIGGTAIGTGLGAERKYIFQVIENLREISDIGLARAENMVENTQNTDVFSEVSGILKAHATNLIKISNDLRLMHSFKEITLPPVQAGSSIMPGKINPVILEMTSQIGLKVLGNDSIISHATALGQLELNQNFPLIAFSILESLELLINTNKILVEKCIKSIKANKIAISQNLNSSTTLLTALLPKIGYKKLSEISQNLENSHLSPKDYILQNKLLTEEEFEYLTCPDAILALGHKNF